MRITDVKTFVVGNPWKNWVFAKMETDAGIVGWSEATMGLATRPVEAAIHEMRPLYLGADPLKINLLWDSMYKGLYLATSSVPVTAMTALEMACWDILGKVLNRPVHALLGGACRDRIKMYRAAGGAQPHVVEPGLPYRAGRPAGPRPGWDDPAAWAEGARVLTQEWGFRCLKVHFSPGPELEATSLVDRYAEQFAAVKQGVGPGVDVAVDIHNPHPSIAAQMIEALAPHRPLFIEEPMPVERVDVLEQIARRTAQAP